VFFALIVADRFINTPHPVRGAVSIDLPLNGRWSDLRADFVWFESADPIGDYHLALEEIGSWQQDQYQGS
jgi:hypothetical protein